MGSGETLVEGAPTGMAVAVVVGGIGLPPPPNLCCHCARRSLGVLA